VVFVVAAPVKRIGTVWLVLLWVALVGGMLLLLALTVQNSTQFVRMRPWILLVNVLAVIAVTVLLARKIWQLVSDYRAQVPGSRLTARTVATFGALVVAPLIIVYLFSLEFLNRGIDSWFRVEIKQGLSDALELSKSALEVRTREYSRRTDQLAADLAGRSQAEIARAIESERRAGGALEIVVFGPLGQVLASSSSAPLEALPALPAAEVLRDLAAGRSYSSIEPLADGQYIIRTAASLAPTPGRQSGRYVLALYPVPPQVAELTEAVQRSFSQHGDLAALREPLKYSFRLTLTLVLLLAMLTAIYGALFFAQRLTRPVQDLIQGTRAVGKGDFGTRLPLPSRDEMGFLVHSFNDMTKRLRRAREETERSQRLVERERERLSIILARLSNGVVAIGPDLSLRSANAAAGAILGAELTTAVGQPLATLAGQSTRVAQFAGALNERLATGRDEWREQIVIGADAARRVLVCACTRLPADDSGDGGFVIVFDDITALLEAQRDAAWGEVARRLAHEIKNPLTPIQLSAERMRRRYLDQMQGEDAQVLDRATHTIVQQVEAMKAMVNAFSEYARAPDMRIASFNLNQLVTEVAELYRSQDSGPQIDLDLDNRLATIEADRGRMRQILNNLITNAKEALESAAGGRVQIATRLEQVGDAQYATLTVSDNGPGFKPELLGRVFDPYVTSKPRGTGLGLAIVKKIIEEHGGRIEADNRPEGGARVRLALPLGDSVRTTAALERRVELRRERA
jgi:nitrogen fixation/metabolism regulation signal transduction histidine kinase